MTRLRAACVAMFIATLCVPAARAAEPDDRALLVFAAASLTDALGELATRWTRASGVPVKLSFAASSMLARQIEAGSRADVFVSADEEWMDYLQKHALIDAASRRDIVGNRLVLIAPADSPVAVRIAPRVDLGGALAGGRLATADPDSVPAGRYARAALTSLGVWDAVSERLARADNVRGALTFVARGEAPLGIVYTTDALADPRVRIVDTFPASSHAPITYPGATLKSARPQSGAFLKFLASVESRTTWKKYGFLEPQ